MKNHLAILLLLFFVSYNQGKSSGLQLKEKDLYLDSSTRGIIMTDFAGQCFRLYIDEDGKLQTVQISCP